MGAFLTAATIERGSVTSSLNGQFFVVGRPTLEARAPGGKYRKAASGRRLMARFGQWINRCLLLFSGAGADFQGGESPQSARRARLHAATLGGTAAVVGQGGNVVDFGYLDAGAVDGTDG